MKTLLLAIFCLLLTYLLQGQNQIGLPRIDNYHSYDYKAGVQNWAIGQDVNGMLYFGNSDGLLSFDGKYWKRYRLPNQTVVRSLKIDASGRIYVGGQSEIGYFFPDAAGRLRYTSLNSLLPEEERRFADIWNLVVVDDQVFFRSRIKIIQYKDGLMNVFKPGTTWDFMGEAGNRIYAQEGGKGILQYDNGVWKPVCNHPVLDQTPITSMMEYGKDTILVATLRNGLFLLYNNTLVPKKTKVDEVFRNDRLYCTAKVNSDWFAFGTNSAGVVILNKEGEHIQTYSYREGLQKNNVRSLLLDRNRNLWIGLDDGIDQLSINSAVKFIYPDKTKQVTGYATRLYQNKLYIGTSNGLYAAPIDPATHDFSQATGSFTEVANTTGQVWNLDEINDHLFIGHEDGGMIVKNNAAHKIYNAAGSWLFKPTSPVYPSSSIIAGTYTGLRLISFVKDQFTDRGSILGLRESLRFMSFDNNTRTLWASHPNRGIFRILLSPDYASIAQMKLYDSKDGLPNENGNYIFRVKNRVVCTTVEGIYEFDAARSRFVVSPTLNSILNGMNIQYLHEDSKGNLWFISHKRLGIVDFQKPSNGSNYTIQYFPELDGMVLSGYESIYPLNEENIFIAANKGIIHLNYKKYCAQQNKPDVLLSQVRAEGRKDSILFGGHALEGGSAVPFKANKVQSLPAHLNSLHFEYSSTLFEQLRNIEFSYILRGFDREWSHWSNRSEKDYTNLPAGHYTFSVKARNNRRNESSVVNYHFEVKRAWYNSYWIFGLYTLIALSTVYLIFRWQQRKHRREREHQHYLHQLELDRSEKEIVELKNQKLETDLNFKNRELLTMTINLVQRGEVLRKIREIISSLIKKESPSDNAATHKNLLRLIREVEKSNEDWDKFAIHFNSVNMDFFNTLKTIYPGLTPNELKLCAYLRMNLSTKEIAQLLNITAKGVEVARYRLRRKLQLQPDVNLADFLAGLSISRSV
jgi:ligand-binding sensor domain-containing protein/DNA-binding CsgD family transcriptional regulator